MNDRCAAISLYHACTVYVCRPSLLNSKYSFLSVLRKPAILEIQLKVQQHSALPEVFARKLWVAIQLAKKQLGGLLGAYLGAFPV